MPPCPSMEPEQLSRAQAFLTWVTARAGDRRSTCWGEYRAFDVYAVAAFALGDAVLGRRLLDRTLDAVEALIASEEAAPGWRSHVADFALVPCLRLAIDGGAALGGGKPASGPDPAQLARLRGLLGRFRWHDDISENHTLLHLAIGLLVGRMFPDLTVQGGRTAAEHAGRAEVDALAWLARWRRDGSTEWGCDIYAQVVLMGLLALADHGGGELAARAADAANLLVCDLAIDLHAGAPVGAARRAYGAYRVDVRESPMRPLFHIWAGSGGEEPWNANFIGGAIQACVSRWRPPAAALRLAGDPEAPFIAASAHRVGLYGQGEWDQPGPAPRDRLVRHTWRQREGVLGAMLAWPSSDRVTETVWQATIGANVPVFACQPADAPWQKHSLEALARSQLPQFNFGRGGEHELWMPGNVPPGHHGDLRPGWWSGHRHGPRSCAWRNLAASVYRIPAADPFPYVHVFVPRARCDAVEEDGPWLWLRAGDGYIGLWCSAERHWPHGGESCWAGYELRLDAPEQAILVVVGGVSTHGDEATFRRAARSLDPTWDAASATLRAETPDGLLVVAHGDEPTLAGAPLPRTTQRLETPWGVVPAEGPGTLAMPGCPPLTIP
jgi:hypothetical protein